MGIYLGNLSVNQIEERLNIILTDMERDNLSKMRESNASNIPPGKWHCFDIPFMILCGSTETAIIVRDMLAPYSDKMKCEIKIGIQ